MRRSSLYLVALVTLSATGNALAQTAQKRSAPPTSLADYRLLLHDYAQAIGSGKRVSPETATRLEKRFDAVSSVRNEDGSLVFVNNLAEYKTLQHIADTRHGAEADEDSQDRARTLDTLIANTPPGVSVGDPDRTAQKVLQSPDFKYAQKKEIQLPQVNTPNWVERFFNWVGRCFQAFGNWLDRVFRWLFRDAHPTGPNSGTMAALASFAKFLFIAVLCIGVFGALAYLAVNWYRGGGRLTLGRRGTETGLDLGPDEINDPLAAARRMSENGDHRGGIRLVYIASLRRLAAAGLIVPEPNKTNWEYQRDLRGRSARVYSAFLPATQLFDRVWYGRRNGSESEFARMLTIHDSLPTLPDIGEREEPGVLAGRETDR